MMYLGVLLVYFTCVTNATANMDFYDEADDFQVQPVDTEKIDHAQLAISNSINGFAHWVDAFFDDDRMLAEEASTRLRIGQAVILQEGESIRLKTRVNVKINIPRFKNRVNLFLSGNEDEANDALSADSSQSIHNEKNTSFGLQYFARRSRKKNFSLTTGIKLDSLEYFFGPRYRRTSVFDEWQTRFTQQIRWFSKKGWQATTSFDQERFITDRAFFRNTLEGRWREKKSDYRIQLNPAVVFRLADKKALQYQLSNEFMAGPEYRLETSVFSIRLRQQYLRDWLFVELQPQLLFSHENGFDPTPGFVIRFEVIFGENKS